MYFSKSDIDSLEKLKRLNLINSIAGIRPANLIGTANDAGQSNLAIFSSVMHLGSAPALMGFILRPEGEVPRNTYENIKHNGCFSINHVHQNFAANAHATSAKYPKDISEFDQCGFTEQWISNFKAPYVKESLLKIGLSYVDSIPIKINGTSLIIGQVEHLYIVDDIINTDGYIDIASIESIGVTGLNNYYGLTKLSTHPYARP